jgi:hypothetical protein
VVRQSSAALMYQQQPALHHPPITCLAACQSKKQKLQ